MSTTIKLELSQKQIEEGSFPAAEVLGDALNHLGCINESLYRIESPNLEDNKSTLLKALITLKTIDKQFCRLIDVQSEEDSIESNFGLNLKLELSKKKLKGIQYKLEILRKEWYLQEEHIAKISSQVKESQKDNDYQSVYAIHQSMILARMLWAASKFNDALECWACNIDNGTENMMLAVNSCMYALIKIYQDEPPDTTSEEYSMVMAMCGMVSNISSIPDGRLYIALSIMSQRAYDTMIWSLPKLGTPEADDLKWIILISIHNLIINENGIEYAKQQKRLIESLSVCIMPPHPNRIIGMSLHIVRTLVEEITEPMYSYHLVKSLPMELVQNFCSCKEDSPIYEDSKFIVEKLIDIYEACKARMEDFAKIECKCDARKSSVKIKTTIIRRKKRGSSSGSTKSVTKISRSTTETGASDTEENASDTAIEKSVSLPTKLKIDQRSCPCGAKEVESTPPLSPPLPPSSPQPESPSRKSSLSDKDREASKTKKTSFADDLLLQPEHDEDDTKCPCSCGLPSGSKMQGSGLQVEELYRNEFSDEKD